jgi:hypothetical protein
MSSRQAQNLARRKAAGICTRCPGTPAPGRTICDTCRARQQAERRSERLKVVSPERPTTRACLRCDRPFASAGPQNRLCRPCLEFVDNNPTPAHTYPLSTRVKGLGG